MEVVAWQPLCKAARAGSGYSKFKGQIIMGLCCRACPRKKRNGDARNAPPLKIRGNNYYTQIVSCFLCFVNVFNTKDVIFWLFFALKRAATTPSCQTTTFEITRSA